MLSPAAQIASEFVTSITRSGQQTYYVGILVDALPSPLPTNFLSRPCAHCHAAVWVGEALARYMTASQQFLCLACVGEVDGQSFEDYLARQATKLKSE